MRAVRRAGGQAVSQGSPSSPLAAVGLVIIMTGAVGVTMAIAGAAQAVVPAIVGILAASVAIGRWRREMPILARRPRLETQAA